MSSSNLRRSETGSGCVYSKIPPVNVFETIYEEDVMTDSEPPSAELAPVQDDDGVDTVSLLVLDGDQSAQRQTSHHRSGLRSKATFNTIMGFMRSGLPKR